MAEESKFHAFKTRLFGKEAVALNDLAQQEMMDGHLAHAAAFGIEGTAKGWIHAANKGLDALRGVAGRVREEIKENGAGATIGGGLLGVPGSIVGAKIQNGITGGQDVKEHGGSPVTPAKPAAQSKGRTAP